MNSLTCAPTEREREFIYLFIYSAWNTLRAGLSRTLVGACLLEGCYIWKHIEIDICLCVVICYTVACGCDVEPSDTAWCGIEMLW